MEILAHLLDEERDDVRARLALLLADPATAWPAIDPAAWVVERGYASRDPAATATAWAGERSRSLAWLRALTAPDWSRSRTHPRLGAISAGDLLAAWAAHDLRQAAQLARTSALALAAAVAALSAAYAG